MWAAYVGATGRFFERGVVGLGYALRISRDEIEEFEARVRAEGVPNFHVQRVGKFEWLYVVTYIEPLAANAAALGLDMASGNTRKAAAEEAMFTDRLVLSRRLRVLVATKKFPA